MSKIARPGCWPSHEPYNTWGSHGGEKVAPQWVAFLHASVTAGGHFYNRDGGGADRDGDHIVLEPGDCTDTITEEGWPLRRCHCLPG